MRVIDCFLFKQFLVRLRKEKGRQAGDIFFFPSNSSKMLDNCEVIQKVLNKGLPFH